MDSPAAAKPLIAIFAIQPDLSRKQVCCPDEVDVVISACGGDFTGQGTVGADFRASAEEKSDAVGITCGARKDGGEGYHTADRMEHQPQFGFGGGTSGGSDRVGPL
jgi:hypothetical protein